MRRLLQRLGFYLFTAWAALTINFFIPRLTPGDPVQAQMAALGGQLDSHAAESLRVLFGLDRNQSLIEQYLHYLGQLSRGDLGVSFGSFPTPVSTVIGQTLPWTLTLIVRNGDQFSESIHGGCIFVPLVGEEGWPDKGL